MTDRFDLDHFFSIPRFSGLRLAPDGSRLAVSVQRPGPDGKKMHASIWEVDPAGARPPRRLTRSAPGESNGTFLRDGSLVFTSTRPDPDASPEEAEGGDDDEVARLWLLPAGGGEARVIAAPPAGVDAVRGARAADVICFQAQIHPGTATLKEDADREKERKKSGANAFLFESYPIAYWDHYRGPRETHLFAAATPDSAEGRIEQPVDLTPGAGRALDETAFDISADGRLVATGWVGYEDLVRPTQDIVLIDRETSDRRTLTPGDAWYSEPRISPDGRSLACLRDPHATPDLLGDRTVWLIDIESGEGRDLSPDLDLWPDHLEWSADGSALFLTADRQGHAAVLRLDVASGDVAVVAGRGAYSDVCVAPDGERLFAIRAAVTSPPRVVELRAGEIEQEPRAIPSPIPPEEELRLGARVEELWTDLPDGSRVHSWLVLPADASPSAPVPLVLWVHGGPVASWNSWHWRWNPHVMADRGYAILLPDPALSTGYGVDWIRRGWGRWGQEPYDDLMAVVDEVTARPEIDADRTAAMGGSYGGYMANWIAGHTDRFLAIVTHASLWELRGFHGTTDWGPTWEQEFGDPYADPARYERESPHQALGAIRTPMLVIHGERDLRVPISEGLRLWTDLRRHGVDSRFLYFPDENHWILRPPNARVWYETVLAFLDQHVLGKEWVRPALL
jgi:dipeptidyl aminopeptidase/acylaminoacyl peptidase